MNHDTNRNDVTTFEIEASTSLLRLISGLVFGRGVELEVRPGSSVRDFLCNQLNLAADYVENRIQTVFLEGKPVDDFDTATLEAGSILALSAAMPGLVGAVFRRGGYYASLRDSITYRQMGGPTGESEKRITLKLFNLTAREIGPQILSQGVYINGMQVADLVRTLEDSFRSGSRRCRINNKQIECQKLIEHPWPDAPVYFRAESDS
ncbi:MAG TPA: hypothetical protein ACFCUC_06935 [Desulfobacterales bacterium]